MDLELLDRLMKLFDESKSETLELEYNDTKIKLSKKAGIETTGNNQGTIIQIGQPAGIMTSVPSSVQQTSVAESSSAQSQQAYSEVSVPKPAASNLHEITSPIVGTFYAAPSPDSDPFVEIGTRVKVGQTLCIVEAMKLMNEIESDVSGIVEEIILTSSNPVEYNQLLFRIKAD